MRVSEAQRLFLSALPVRETGVLHGSQTTMAHWLKSRGLVALENIKEPGESLSRSHWVITPAGRAVLKRE
jgi:hypothetical protein